MERPEIKVGMEFTIREGLKCGKNYGATDVTNDMLKYKGMNCIVEEVCGYDFKINLDSNYYFWTWEMMQESQELPEPHIDLLKDGMKGVLKNKSEIYFIPSVEKFLDKEYGSNLMDRNYNDDLTSYKRGKWYNVSELWYEGKLIAKRKEKSPKQIEIEKIQSEMDELAKKQDEIGNRQAKLADRLGKLKGVIL